MESSFPWLLAAVVGFSHAFEAEHLVAVGSIVTRRDRWVLALKDGIYWGLGHSSTILLIGLLMIVARATFLEAYFGFFEALVGLMLIALGFFRLYRRGRGGAEEVPLAEQEGQHHLAYGVGLLHGLAGSGALVVLVMAEWAGTWASMGYLLVFGAGSVVGMLVAAGIFGLPFCRRWTVGGWWSGGLVWLSSLLCMGYGGYLFISQVQQLY